MEQLIQLGNLAISWALFGLIWVVQLLHYPAFRYVGDFTAFHKHHTSSITLIVGPMMFLELGLASYLAWQAEWAIAWLIPLFVVLVIWLLTFFWAVPIHEKLGRAPSDALISQLLLANWPRTILWTLKAGWVTLMFYRSSP